MCCVSSTDSFQLSRPLLHLLPQILLTSVSQLGHVQAVFYSAESSRCLSVPLHPSVAERLFTYLSISRETWLEEREWEGEREGGESRWSRRWWGGGDCLLLMPCGNMAERAISCETSPFRQLLAVSLLVCSSSTGLPLVPLSLSLSLSPPLSLSLCFSPNTHLSLCYPYFLLLPDLDTSCTFPTQQFHNSADDAVGFHAS